MICAKLITFSGPRGPDYQDVALIVNIITFAIQVVGKKQGVLIRVALLFCSLIFIAI